MTERPDARGSLPPQPSMAAVRAAGEISEKLGVLPVYSQALAESFAGIIERHTRCRELLVACKLAKEALEALRPSKGVAARRCEDAIVALEQAITSVERQE